MNQRKEVTADTAGIRSDYTLNGVGRDGAVDRIAASAHDFESGMARQQMRGGRVRSMCRTGDDKSCGV